VEYALEVEITYGAVNSLDESVEIVFTLEEDELVGATSGTDFAERPEILVLVCKAGLHGFRIVARA
jgi:hypothetical protein